MSGSRQVIGGCVPGIPGDLTVVPLSGRVPG